MAGIELIDIHKTYRVDNREIPVLNGINLSLPAGRITVILGQSGCGKTTLLRLTGGLETADSGEIRWESAHKTAFVFQEPRLMPWLTVWENVVFGLSKKEIDPGKIEAVIRTVGLSGFEKAYPSQLSGGMRQRIVLAIALAGNPEILFADEPTTALDVTIQAQILDLLREIQKKLGTATVFVTHDLGVVARIADRVAVMYAGKIVEIGTVDEIFYDPRHPYTWGLLRSIPAFSRGKESLPSIPGMPPSLLHPPKGDAFASRNAYALEIDFEEEPPMFRVTDSHYAATWLLDERAPKVVPPIGGNTDGT